MSQRSLSNHSFGNIFYEAIRGSNKKFTKQNEADIMGTQKGLAHDDKEKSCEVRRKEDGCKTKQISQPVRLHGAG